MRRERFTTASIAACQGDPVARIPEMPPTVRLLCTTLSLAYIAGAPAFAELRPRPIDEALGRFHADVTLAAGQGTWFLHQLATAERRALMTERALLNVGRAFIAAR
jgi:hypothetical protein